MELCKKIILIFLLATLARCVSVSLIGWQSVPDSDSIEYLQYGHSLRETGMFTDGHSKVSRPPGYPALIAIVGRSVCSLKFIQVLFSSGICVLVFLMARNILEERKALIAAGIALVYYDLLLMPGHVLSETLFVFLLYLSLTCLMYFYSNRNMRLLVFSAVVLGLATLTRPITLIFPAFVILWLCLLEHTPIQKITYIVLFLAYFIVPIGFWASRNYAVTQAFVPVNIQAGRDMWASNNAWSKGQWDPSHLEFDKYKDLGELARDKAYYAEGIAYVRSLNPVDLIRHEGLKLGSLVYPFLPEYDLTFMLALPFFMIGLLVAILKREQAAYILVACIAFLLLITAVFYGSPRFRSVMSPSIIVIATAGYFWLYEHIKNKRVFVYGTLLWLASNIVVCAYAEPIRLTIKTLRG